MLHALIVFAVLTAWVAGFSGLMVYIADHS